MTQINKLEVLRNSPLATDLDAAEMQALADQMGVTTLHHGETLVSEGDARQTLFLLGAGALNVTRVGGGKEEIIYQMHRGECAGTRSFIDGSVRKAGLISVGDSSVLTLEPAAFEALGDLHPRLLYRVMRALFRLTHTNLMRMNSESAELRNYLLKTGGRY